MAARKKLPVLAWLGVALLLSGCAAGMASPPERKGGGGGGLSGPTVEGSSGGSGGSGKPKKAKPVGCWAQAMTPSAPPCK